MIMDRDVVNLETDKIESLDFLSSQGVDDHPAEPVDFWARLMPLNSSLLTVQCMYAVIEAELIRYTFFIHFSVPCRFDVR